MENYQLTKEAQNDLSGIYEYSIENFGLEKAQEYFLSFERAFELISSNPQIGRDFSFVKENYRRYEHRSHSVYYKLERKTVLIIRVLGMSQDTLRNLKQTSLT